MPISSKDVPSLPERGCTEAPSDTFDHQRFDEMLVHLTPLGCTIPYNVAYDGNGDIWVAGKGGLFKICGQRNFLLWSAKNDFPKKQAAYPQVVVYKDTIIHTTADDNEKITEMRFFEYDGTKKHEQFIDGLIQSLVVSESGIMYITKQLKLHGESSIIYKTSIETPLGWEELCSDDDLAFQALCSFDDSLLISACAKMPVNMYSKQCLKWIDANTGETIKRVSVEGRKPGEIFFPRKIHRLAEDIVLMDKTGRFLKFDKTGEYIGVVAEIDAYLANGFCIQGNEATIACSGIVQNDDKRSLCDDWLENIRLDGSSWKQQREKLAQ
ncbi:unnamed protein product, partial [Mesorhabditis belari]|uniref:Uncharacterized protein n=1 Tax=Mesorhabditis belari TaxID=2138241 RepID=A0AAF3J1X3_9BILA